MRVNEEIARTLRDPQQRAKFYFFNNGITIICNKFGYNAFADKDLVIQIAGLQIVNGGQTSKTIQQIQKELGPEIGAAQVLVRIYELPDEDEELVSVLRRLQIVKVPWICVTCAPTTFGRRDWAIQSTNSGLSTGGSAPMVPPAPLKLQARQRQRRFLRFGDIDRTPHGSRSPSISASSMIKFLPKTSMAPRSLSLFYCSESPE